MAPLRPGDYLSGGGGRQPSLGDISRDHKGNAFGAQAGSHEPSFPVNEPAEAQRGDAQPQENEDTR